MHWLHVSNVILKVWIHNIVCTFRFEFRVRVTLGIVWAQSISLLGEAVAQPQRTV